MSRVLLNYIRCAQNNTHDNYPCTTLHVPENLGQGRATIYIHLYPSFLRITPQTTSCEHNARSAAKRLDRYPNQMLTQRLASKCVMQPP